MLNAYLDESGIHMDAKVCVIAGYCGGRAQFARLENAWKNVLTDFDFPLHQFHAKKLFGKPKHEPMLAALAQAISEQKKIHPISLAIVVEDFNCFSVEMRRWMTGGIFDAPTGQWIEGGCPKKPYFVPFQICLGRLTDCAPVGGKVNFFFGLDQVFAKVALALFKQVKTQLSKGAYESEWKTKDRLGEPDFPLASETPQLQAADLLAHLSYQRILQHYSTDDWGSVPTSGTLADCVRNTLSLDHHGVMNKKHLEQTFEMAQARASRQKTLLRAP